MPPATDHGPFQATVEVKSIARVQWLTLTGVLAFAAISQGGAQPADWNACLFLLGLAGLSAALWGAPRPKPTRFDQALIVLLGAFLGYVAFQMAPLPETWLAAVSPNRALQITMLREHGIEAGSATISVAPSASLAHFLRICGAAIVFLLVYQSGLISPRRRWQWAAPLIVVAGAEAALGIAQSEMGEGASGAHGTYINPNHFAGLLELALPFAVVYPVTLLASHGGKTDLPLRTAVRAGAVWAVAALILVGILFSLSRMGFISTLSSMAFLVLLAVTHWASRGGGRRRMPLLCATALILAAGMTAVWVLPSDALVERFAQLASSKTVTAEGRLKLWKETWSLVEEYPLVGVGLGGFHSAFPKYKKSAPLLDDDHVHNDYLEALAELGVIGFVLIGSLVALVFGRTVRLSIRAAGSEQRYVPLACAASMAAILLHGVADFNLYIPANTLGFAWVLGMAASIRSSHSGRGRRFHSASWKTVERRKAPVAGL